MLTSDMKCDPSTIHVESEIAFVRGIGTLQCVLRPHRVVQYVVRLIAC